MLEKAQNYLTTAISNLNLKNRYVHHTRIIIRGQTEWLFWIGIFFAGGIPVLVINLLFPDMTRKWVLILLGIFSFVRLIVQWFFGHIWDKKHAADNEPSMIEREQLWYARRNKLLVDANNKLNILLDYCDLDYKED